MFQSGLKNNNLWLVNRKFNESKKAKLKVRQKQMKTKMVALAKKL